MKTSYNNKLKRWTMLLLPLLIVGLMLAACDGDDDNDNEAGAGGGLDATPVVVATDVVPDEEPDVDMTDTPEMVEETPMTEPTTAVTVTMEATEVMTETETPDDTIDTAETHGVIQASDLIGADVEDQAGEIIGSVTEALANQDGQIDYVIVDLIEVMTDGDAGETVTETVDTDPADAVAEFNLVSMAWDDFTFQFDVEDEDLLDKDRDFNVVLNGDMANMTTTTLDPEFLTFLNSDDYIMDEGLDADMDVPAEFVGLLQVSAYDDFELENTAEDDLGDTEDLLIDIQNGRILYAILDVGGFLGIGENEIAIPWSAVVLDETTLEDDGEIFRIDVDESFLNDAPTIDLENWASEVEENWDEAYRDYWVDFIEEF